MKNIKIKVYHLFFAIALIVLFIGIIQKDNTIDINIHDTYFVISYHDVSLVLFQTLFAVFLMLFHVVLVFCSSELLFS